MKTYIFLYRCRGCGGVVRGQQITAPDHSQATKLLMAAPDGFALDPEVRFVSKLGLHACPGQQDGLVTSITELTGFQEVEQ